jgi:enoyl-CoA hydratase
MPAAKETPMPHETVLCESKGPVAWVTINRPKVLNALSPQVLDELDQVFSRLQDDQDIRCVALTGAGEKAFVAGADIAAMAAMTPLQGRNFSRLGQKVLARIAALEKPVIAAVNGYALGGGTELAMACDFIYASENAKFGLPEITLGIIPGFGGTQRLARLLGLARAKELCFSGDIFSARQALEMGLVNKVFAPDELTGAVNQRAEQIAGFGRVALRAIKNSMNQGYDLPMERAIPADAEHIATCFSSEDRKEGMEAFLEKRKAVFKGLA